MSHQHGTSSCSCDHSPIDEGQIVNGAIDLKQFRVLNCSIPSNQHFVLENNDENVRSNEFDPELLLVIPFTSPTTIKSFCLLVNDPAAAPITAKLFANSPISTDFTSIESMKPTQTVQLAIEMYQSGGEKYFYPVNVPKFANITSFAILLQGTEDQDAIEVAYLGLKGTASGFKRDVVHAKYESRPQLADHSSSLSNELTRSALS
jgi:PITH domain